MHKTVGLLWIAGFFGLLAVADAQTPSPPATVTQFDGIYAPVSATKVNETFTHIGTNRIDRCGDYATLQPLIILNGEARYPGRRLEGVVGSQGELAIRFVPEPAVGGVSPGVERVINGRIDGDGTVRARQIGYHCSYDLIWQKVQTLSAPIASAQFDGTYAFVSATKLNETFMAGGTRLSPCGDLKGGLLTIVNGHARYTVDGPGYEGTVNSQGELEIETTVSEIRRIIFGRIEANGTVRARRITGGCSYDLILQRQSN